MFAFGGQRLAHKCYKVLRLTFVNFSNKDLKDLNPVKKVVKTIESNTSIFIESPVHVSVQPIDVNDLEAHNQLTMTLYSRGKDAEDFFVKQSTKRLELLNKNMNADRSDVCVIQIPYQLKMQVTTTDDASVQISKVEGEDITVQTENGKIDVMDLKAQSIKLESGSGAIESAGRIQAKNIDIKTGGQGGVSCHNVMANNFLVTTHAGPIDVKSCYSDKSHFTTLMGNIHLDHLHRAVIIDVIQQGNLHITSFSGSLQASLKSGDVYMLASQLIDKSSIFIHEKGKVELLIPDILRNLPATNLIAEKISVDDKILKLGRFMDDSHPKRFRFEKEPQDELHIVCKNGSIDLKESNKLPFMTTISTSDEL